MRGKRFGNDGHPPVATGDIIIASWVFREICEPTDKTHAVEWLAPEEAKSALRHESQRWASVEALKRRQPAPAAPCAGSKKYTKYEIAA